MGESTGIKSMRFIEYFNDPLRALSAVLIALGAVLRVKNFDLPPGFLFDEHHFVENARNYLAGRPDWNDHPPLGKLFIAVAIRIWGDNSFAWRMPALFFGFFVIGAAGWAAARLFKNVNAGWLAAALLSSDGFLISYSRGGLLDVYLAAFAIAALLLSTFAWSARTALVAGVVVGLASSIKFSGVGASFPLVVSLLIGIRENRERLKLAAVSAAAAAVVYYGCFAVGLRLVGQTGSVQQVIDETLRLLRHHASLTDMKNSWVSGWPTWVVPVRPIMVGFSSMADHNVRVLTSLGNLATWWSAMVVGIGAAAVVVWRGISRVESERPAETERNWFVEFVAADGRAVLKTLALTAGFLAPWVLTHRDSYIYHFLPCYTALVVLLAGALERRSVAHYRVALGFMVCVLLVTAFYAPVWSFEPISQAAMMNRLPLPSWR